MKDGVSVLVRLRTDVSPNEPSWRVVNNSLRCEVPGRENAVFSCFDKIIHGCSNRELYAKYLRDSVLESLSGKNCTIFAYGQTGSGKTFTMMGNEAEVGIVRESIEDIFDNCAERVVISYIEIYNEKIYDLIDLRNDVKLYSINDKPQLSHLAEVSTTSVKEALDLIEVAERKRRFGCTEYNKKSSRSHTVFRMKVFVKGSVGVLLLIDLAGSERVSDNHERKVEGSFINRSLLALGNVVNAILNGRPVGFRDSKLTRILQPSMCGSASIIALCTISPLKEFVDETISTLMFASRLCKVKIARKDDRASSRVSSFSGSFGRRIRVEYVCKVCKKVVTKDLYDVSDGSAELIMRIAGKSDGQASVDEDYQRDSSCMGGDATCEDNQTSRGDSGAIADGSGERDESGSISTSQDGRACDERSIHPSGSEEGPGSDSVSADTGSENSGKYDKEPPSHTRLPIVAGSEGEPCCSYKGTALEGSDSPFRLDSESETGSVYSDRHENDTVSNQSSEYRHPLARTNEGSVTLEKRNAIAFRDDNSTSSMSDQPPAYNGKATYSKVPAREAASSDRVEGTIDDPNDSRSQWVCDLNSERLKREVGALKNKVKLYYEHIRTLRNMILSHSIENMESQFIKAFELEKKMFGMRYRLLFKDFQDTADENDTAGNVDLLDFNPFDTNISS